LTQPRLVHLDYAERFRCIGSACEDTCCKGWGIPIDREAYEKYRNLPPSPLRNLIQISCVPRHNSVHLRIQQHRNVAENPICYNLAAMFDLFQLWCGAIVRTFRCRRGLMLENLALRQQLVVLKRKHPRPKLGPLDKLFWVVALRFWSRWKETLVLVLPETVVRWHRAGFRRYWAMLCKRKNESAVAGESANRSAS